MVSPSGTVSQSTAADRRCSRIWRPGRCGRGMRHGASRSFLSRRVGLMSLAVLVALGVAIGLTLKHQIEDRALDRATQFAQVIADVGIGSRLEPSDLDSQLSFGRMETLDRVLGARVMHENRIDRIKVFSR